MEQFVRDYGYAAIVVVTFFEGETIVILAGIAASLGYLHLTSIIAAALTGSIAGDQTWFYVGRRWGTQLLDRREVWRQRADRVFMHLQRHQTWLMLTFRFYYGLRSVTPFAIGAARVSRLRFLTLNAGGAVIWAVSFTFTGYLCGKAGASAVDKYNRYALLAVGVIAVIATAWVLLGKRKTTL